MRDLGAFSMQTLAKSALFVFALALTSCSGGKSGLYPVKGTVLFKDSPAGGVMVALHPAAGDDPKAQVPSGLTADDGTFNISTGQDDGAPAGEYVATLVWMVEPTGKKKPATGMIMMNSDVALVDKFKNKYGDRRNPAFSGITIKKGVNQLEPFNLK